MLFVKQLKIYSKYQNNQCFNFKAPNSGYYQAFYYDIMSLN